MKDKSHVYLYQYAALLLMQCSEVVMTIDAANGDENYIRAMGTLYFIYSGSTHCRYLVPLNANLHSKIYNFLPLVPLYSI